jgi:hypothetical protein
LQQGAQDKEAFFSRHETTYHKRHHVFFRQSTNLLINMKIFKLLLWLSLLEECDRKRAPNIFLLLTRKSNKTRHSTLGSYQVFSLKSSKLPVFECFWWITGLLFIYNVQLSNPHLPALGGRCGFFVLLLPYNFWQKLNNVNFDQAYRKNIENYDAIWIQYKNICHDVPNTLIWYARLVVFWSVYRGGSA